MRSVFGLSTVARGRMMRAGLVTAAAAIFFAALRVNTGLSGSAACVAAIDVEKNSTVKNRLDKFMMFMSSSLPAAA